MINGGLEAAGDALTGAVLSRVVEPEAWEGASIGHGACLNCGVKLVGANCHGCGQKAQVHRTLRSYGHDLLHGVFHFEGKVWKTLPMLAFKPGELTRRYIHGERAKFVSPLALFLFAVFLMFAVFESVGGPMSDSRGGKSEFSFNTALDKSQDKVVTLARERGRLAALGKDVKKVDAQLAEEREGRDFLLQMQNMVAGKPYKLKADFGIDSGLPALDEGVRHALENPKLLLYKLQSSAYKFAWALIPLSLPFMWLMFAWRPQYKVYDHAIFVTYSLSFVMMLLVVMAIVSAFGISAALLLTLLPVHFSSSLKVLTR